jgi:osmoprotectant transport system substrate-binding protein
VVRKSIKSCKGDVILKKKIFKVFIISVLILGMLGTLAGCGKKSTVRIVAQNVNETVILAHMAKLLVEDRTDLKASVNTEFTGSSVLHQAMQSNEIDIYPTWTGTQLTGVLRYEGPNLSPEESYKKVYNEFKEKFNMIWGEPLGFNNTYIMTVTKEMADKYNLKNSSDLAPYAKDWRLAGDANFDTRPDAYPGWSEAYGIEFKDVLPMQYGLGYMAIEKGEVEVTVAYSTDSRIKRLNLVMLPDDKQFFPDYSGAFIFSGKFLNNNEKVLDILNELGGMISTEEMGALNLRYDTGEEPDVIAKDFLIEKGLIK